MLPRWPPCNILIRTKYAKTEAISQSRLHHHSSSSLPSRIESRNAKKRICSMIHHTARGYRKLPTTYMYLLPPTSDVTSPDNNIWLDTQLEDANSLSIEPACAMSELSIFLFFSFLILFFRNKALTSDFQRFFPFLLWTVYTRIARAFPVWPPYSPFFGGPSRMFLVELLVDDG